VPPLAFVSLDSLAEDRCLKKRFCYFKHYYFYVITFIYDVLYLLVDMLSQYYLELFDFYPSFVTFLLLRSFSSN